MKNKFKHISKYFNDLNTIISFVLSIGLLIYNLIIATGLFNTFFSKLFCLIFMLILHSYTSCKILDIATHGKFYSLFKEFINKTLIHANTDDIETEIAELKVEYMWTRLCGYMLINFGLFCLKTYCL